MSKNANSQPEAANLNSEKTKDIRMTNIIAARGKPNTTINILPCYFTSTQVLKEYLSNFFSCR